MKKLFQTLLVAVAALSLANCTTTTRVVEVTPYTPPPKKVVHKPKPSPGPSEFKVVNQYDDQRL